MLPAIVRLLTGADDIDTGEDDPYILSAMKTRETIRGFEVISRSDLTEYRARGTHLRHPGTGCEIVHLASADTENLFAFCFATPPRDDTGVSHIIEHSVLSGSRRYPLKEPFSVLMKGSMHTFLNALTYPDRTVYPAASCNHADFYNLLSVYGDAVFHPLLRKETFMQEAWRLEEAAEGGGIDAVRYAGHRVQRDEGRLFEPGFHRLRMDHPARSSPTPRTASIRGATRASFPVFSLASAREFHERYYHPSNCRIFLYGDIPLEEILAYIDGKFPLRLHRAAHRRGDTPAAALDGAPKNGENISRQGRHAPGREIERDHELAPAAGRPTRLPW